LTSEIIGQLVPLSVLRKKFSYNSQLAGVRQDRQSVERAAIAGSSTAPDLRAGYTFTLTDQTGGGLGGTYLVTSVHHAGFLRVTNGVSKLFYGNQFEVIPASLTYRPALTARKPLAQPTTAVVTGPAGETIYADQYGRVKVQFNWDRTGTADQNSSAWLRVASPMAGSGHGMIFLPHGGDEVLVTFIDGDPDQPVVAGSLYNAAAPTPYALPANKTVSTIRGTPSSGAVNELEFDDLAGSQALNLKGAKDLQIRAGNNLSISATGWSQALRVNWLAWE
jgi:type VI secretion system secreted protein VgrG